MSQSDYSTKTQQGTSNKLESINWRSNTTPPVQFAINDPPELEIDLRQELEHWQTMLGYCTTQVKRLQEQLREVEPC